MEELFVINIAICDDEKPFQNTLEKMVSRYMDSRDIECSITLFDNGKDLVEYCKDYDQRVIVFLDINMDDIDGIETGKMIRELSPDIYIVFVTAYIKYSLDGYKVKAIRYLIKGDRNFEQSLEECINEILRDMDYGIRKVTFRFKEGEKELQVDNIIYIESDLHTINVFVSRSKKRKYTMTSTLNDVEKMMEGCGFLRIHQSFLINLKHVKCIRRYVAEMDNGTELSIPRAKYRTVKEAYIEYKGEI